MALTQIKTGGIQDDAVTSSKIPANAVGSSELADNAVDTNAIQDDAVTADKLANSINTAIAANTAKTSNATHTGDVTGSTSLTIANDAVTNGKIVDGAVTTTKIADEAVTLAKLEHGTSSNDGKFLRANNGADPSFETVSIPAGITINNQADNRVITATGTTNTLNGESNVVIDANGRVGIGTTNPLEQLVVMGTGDPTIRIEELASGSGKRLELGVTDSGAVGFIAANQSASKLAFKTVGNERMRIDASGRVGIGTDSPDRLFHVEGDGSAIIRLTDNDTTGENDSIIGMIEFETKDSNGAGVAANIRSELTDTTNGAGSLAFSTGTPSSIGTRMIINSAGNVGIGTQSPTDKLHVNGTSLLGGNTYITSNTYLSANKGIYFDGGSTSANYLDDYEEGQWTPSIAGLSISNLTNTGRYIKIGNQVTIVCYINIGTKTYDGGTSSTALQINGLPFQCGGGGTGWYGAAIGNIQRLDGGNTTQSTNRQIAFNIGPGYQALYARWIQFGNNSFANSTLGDLYDSFAIHVSITYRTA